MSVGGAGASCERRASALTVHTQPFVRPWQDRTTSLLGVSQRTLDSAPVAEPTRETAGSSWPNESCVDDRRDLVLIEQIASQNAAALAELYDRRSGLLYGLLVRMLRDRGEAEEVLQEAFLAVWSRARTYNRALGSPVAWLVGITRNRAIDRMRANAVRQRTAEQSGSSAIDASDSPETQASFSEKQRQLARALGVLPREQRQLIEDAYFLGLTQSELAARHQLPLGTVKTRIRTGMLTLRQQLSHLYAMQ